ncbi:MAG: UDP-N-acetylglucosamine 1-carboxyvinyltransferase [Oscillospiraceae bacterium]|nr:UDP-N-acetylglucosamine 1-carboxyvinyltransferase [Oscillospiraceae bacterium]
MSFYEICGGRPLRGELRVQGAKNSALPILAAALLAPGQSVIRNCPDLSDVTAALEILRLLGCRAVREEDAVLIDASQLTSCGIPDRLMREMRSSVIFLGALLARLGRAELSYPGGCELGPRPIDLHLAALRGLGAEITEEQGRLTCTRGQGLMGRELCLSIPSVGATENAMLAACEARGVTTIVGAAREPEIVDLQRFLNAMGARVSGAGSPVISIQGGAPLHGAEHTVMGDRIAAATYLCAVGAVGGELRLTGADPADLAAVCCCLEEAGCRLRTDGEGMSITASGRMRGIRTVRTAPYPGFPTDAQAILMAALAGGTGTTMMVENMFDSRYRHVDELARMGADIQLAGRVAVVTGSRLHGAEVRSTDLRGGAALVVAALGAEGVSRVSGLSHIRRGYQGLDDGLATLGADIRTRL